MKLVIGLILILIGIISVITGSIIQTVVALQTYGFALEHALIRHWSLWFYTGFIPMIIGYCMTKGE